MSLRSQLRSDVILCDGDTIWGGTSDTGSEWQHIPTYIYNTIDSLVIDHLQDIKLHNYIYS